MTFLSIDRLLPILQGDFHLTSSNFLEQELDQEVYDHEQYLDCLKILQICSFYSTVYCAGSNMQPPAEI